MSTPPPGWNPQQQPGWNPHQQPPPGWGQQPPPPGWGQQPPKKTSKTPLVIVLVIGVLVVLGGGGAAAYFYTQAHRDRGRVPTGNQVPQMCAGVSKQTLARLRTTNPGVMLYTEILNKANCSWEQTIGVDGEGNRGLSMEVVKFTKAENGKSPEQQAKEAFAAVEPDLKRTANVLREGPPVLTPQQGLGDEALLADTTGGSGITGMVLAVRKGGAVLTVSYTGYDIGIFSPVDADLAEFEAAVRAVVSDMLPTL
jgi:hypothetical protein